MQGTYFWEYLSDPNIAKTDDEIYADLDRFTWECYPRSEPQTLTTSVMLPPLSFRGVFLKGLLFSTDMDYLLARWPLVGDLFVTLGNSRSCAYSWSRKADGLCALYDNPIREAAFRARNPDRNHQILVPIQTADWTHEKWFCPPETVVEKDIDILCVSRLTENKNLPFLCRAIAVYLEKYGPIRLAVTGDPHVPWNRLENNEAKIFNAMTKALNGNSDALCLLPFVNPCDIRELYSRARCFVLGALIEGKNRALHEALCCDVPVVLFDDFNQWARGEAKAFPEGAGLTSPFHEEALADTLHQVLERESEFAPREAYLSGFSGRLQTIQKCLQTIPYFAAVLPGFSEGVATGLKWLDEALQKEFGCTLNEWVYAADWQPLRHLVGASSHHQAVTRFSLVPGINHTTTTGLARCTI